MKASKKYFVTVLYFTFLLTYGQRKDADFYSNPGSLTNALEILPEISSDSTQKEISAHIDAMLNWMTEELYKTNYAPILIYADKGLSLAEKSENSQHMYDVRAVIGNTLMRIEDTIGAKKLFLKSLEEAQKSKDSSLILQAKGNLANVYYFTEGYKSKIIKEYLESIKIAERLNDTRRLFVFHHNLSRAYNELKQPEESAYHIKKTEEYLQIIGGPAHYQASHFHNIGRRYLLLNQIDDAIENFEKTIALCENTEFTEALIEGYVGLKDALEMKKDYKGVYDLSKTLELYEAEKKKNEAKNIIESVSARINVERYKDQIKSEELEKQLLIEQAERKNILLALFIGIGLFLMLILSVTFYAYKRRQKLVKNLQLKNKQYLLAKQQSEQFTKAKAKFFATVSHELRTPLYGVIGLSSILMENNDLKKHEKDFKSLKFSANYLLALINDLLQINKIENDSFTKEETKFDLREQINTIISSFEYIRLQHKNQIRVKLSEDIPALLKGNSVRLSQILMNLVGNACKFTENGIIEVIVNVIETNQRHTKLQFIVKDNGPGIEATKLKNIFDEFTQADSLTNNYQGSGLGLSIVKKLLDQAGSTITVESELGKGSKFEFDLELNTIKKDDIEAIDLTALDTNYLAKKYILVVEDNRINQTVTRKILENSKVKCDIAQNGEEAVAMVKKNRYDLVLMDINMPVKNGIDATKDIRTFNEVIPIIALTAVEIEEQSHLIFESGMNDIIVKPYDIDLFKKTILKNLANASSNGFRKLA